MLREKFREDLKKAMYAKETIKVSTLRLILAALKDRDIAARSKGNMEGVLDSEILSMLQTMVKQRKESTEIYEKAGRTEMADREKEEVVIIEYFLPQQLSVEESQEAAEIVIKEIGAEGLKDMGRIMARLKELYAGQMDFGRVSGMVKAILTASK